MLRQFTKYYKSLAATGQIDAKHEEMILEELSQKIKKLKM